MGKTDRSDWVKKIKKEGIIGIEQCPFCKKEDSEIILKETSYWEVWYNKFPYYGNKQNLLVVSKRHIEKTTQLKDEELLDFKNIEIFMEDYFKGKNYMSFIRQTNGGRSIEHLHYHYLEGIFYHDIDSGNKNFKIKL